MQNQTKKPARKPATKRRPQKGGEPENKEKKGLIITTGDASDFDGFMALPLYYKAAQKHNMDVMFIMNFPAYFGFDDDDKKTVENGLKDNTGTSIKDALPLGLGFNYGHKEFCTVKNYRDGKFALKHQQLKSIEDAIIKKYKNEKTTKDIDMDIMSFITYRIVMEIWTWCARDPTIHDPTFSIPNLKFCIGGINSINPFPAISIKNEFDVYGGIIAKSFEGRLLTTPPLKTSIVDYFTQIGNNNIINICKDADKIYIDMNGSMAWYGETMDKAFKDKALKDKVQGVFVMGGVLSYSQVNTMGAGPFVNRLSCATMNQLYHAKNTGAFFANFKDKLYFITNNEINANFTYLPQNAIYPDKISYPYEDFKIKMADLFLIPKTTEEEHIVCKLFEAFYQPRPGDRKPFDVISALALVQFIDGQGSSTFAAKSLVFDSGMIQNDTNKKELPLYYNDEYGITILGYVKSDDLSTGLYYGDKKILSTSELPIIQNTLTTEGKTEGKTTVIGNVRVLYGTKTTTEVIQAGKTTVKHDNAYEIAIKNYMNPAENVSQWAFADEFAWPINIITRPDVGGGTKIYILGRSRKIIPKGRYQYIMYNKEHITINAARKLELKRQKSKRVVARK